MKASGFHLGAARRGPVAGSGSGLGFQSLEFPAAVITQADGRGREDWKPGVVLFFDPVRRCYVQRGGGMEATAGQVARHWGRFFVEAAA